MKKTILSLSLVALTGVAARGDVVYVTAMTSNCISTTVCGNSANFDVNPNTGFAIYNDNALSFFTSAISSNPEKPPTPGARAFGVGFTNTTPDLGITINPALGVPGGVYRIYHVYSSTAGNVSTNLIMGITNVADCTLSATNTDKFQRQYGLVSGGANQYQFLGFVTNNPGTANPVITFYYVSGSVDAGAANQRLVVDTFRFILNDPCLDIPNVSATGPLGASLNDVVVTGVSASATAVTVYQDSGAGMVQIGTLNAGVVAGNNSVPVTGLVKGAQVAATQTIGGTEGCTPTAGLVVGGGANPRVRVVLSVRETPSTGPVGASGSTAGVGANIHFLGASFRNGSAPGDGPVMYPSNDWQTITFDRGTARIGSPANLAGVRADGPGYLANDTVAVRVYAYQFVPGNGTQIYSTTPAESSTVTSNDTFVVNWTWDAVPGADGYRLLRNYNSDNYAVYSTDALTTSFNDDNTVWGGLAPVTPTFVQTNASIKWNAATGSTPIGTQNDIQGQWGVIDAIALAIDDLTDTGSYDFYIDNLKNGSTVFQNWESAVGNTAEYGFRAPGFSGSTSGNLLGAPNSSRVSVRAADTGTKSLHVKFQWNGTNNTKWLRLTTSTALGVSNPQINLDDPTSIRFLMLPVGGSLPAQPAAPTLSISNNAAGQTVLNWTGGHNLQASSLAPGTYTNTGVTLGPWTNTLPDSEKFFRLSDPYDN